MVFVVLIDFSNVGSSHQRVMLRLEFEIVRNLIGRGDRIIFVASEYKTDKRPIL